MPFRNLRSCLVAVLLVVNSAASQTLPDPTDFPECAQTCVGALGSTSCSVTNLQRLSCCLTNTCDDSLTKKTFEVANKACHRVSNSTFEAVATCLPGYSFIGAATTSTSVSGGVVHPPLPTAFGGSSIDTAYFLSQQSTIVLSTGYPATIVPIANYTSPTTSGTTVVKTSGAQVTTSASTRPDQVPSSSTSGVAPFNSGNAAVRERSFNGVDTLLVLGGALAALL